MDKMWDILGIATPTAEIGKIKAAYSVRLKVLEQKQDEDAVSELRWAFREASEYSEKQRMYEAPTGETDAVATNTDAILEAEKDDLRHLQARKFLVEDNGEKLVCSDLESQCFEKIYALLNNPWKRVNENAWHDFFDEFTAGNSDIESEFGELLRKALLHHYGYFSADSSQRNKSFGVRDMPARVSTYIFHRMGWLEHKKNPVNIQSEIDWLRNELDVQHAYQPIEFNAVGDSVFDSWNSHDEKAHGYHPALSAGMFILWLLVLLILGILKETV